MQVAGQTAAQRIRAVSKQAGATIPTRTGQRGLLGQHASPRTLPPLSCAHALAHAAAVRSGGEAEDEPGAMHERATDSKSRSISGAQRVKPFDLRARRGPGG